MSTPAEKLARKSKMLAEQERVQYVPDRGFRFLTADEMLLKPRLPSFLIKPYVEEGTLIVLFGEPESMKSFVALDQGLCIASKTDWHGHPVEKAGPVFYIAGEGFMGLSKRMKAWQIAHKVDLTKVPFFTSNQAAQFLNPESAEEVVAAVEEMRKRNGGPVLIIIDTLNRNFGPGDENSTADMSRFVAVIDTQLRARYGCTVLIVHHSGLNAKDRARGAGALRAALDWEYRLTKGAGGTRTLEATKVKDHEPPPAISFKPEIINLEGWHDQDGQVMTSCVLRQVENPQLSVQPLKGSQKIAMEALHEAIRADGRSGMVHINSWREIAYRKGITASPEKAAKRQALHRAVASLLERGLIETRDDYYWPKCDKT